MNYELLTKIINDYHIPKNVHLLSDSGWECFATEMNGMYFNRKQNVIVFTQGDERYHNENYPLAEGWIYLENGERKVLLDN